MSGLQNNYSMCFNASLKKHFWWININCDCLLKAHNVSGTLATDILHPLMLTMLKNRRVDVTRFDSNTWRVGITRSDRKRWWGKERVSKERQDDKTNKGIESGFEPRSQAHEAPDLITIPLWALNTCMSVLPFHHFTILVRFSYSPVWGSRLTNFSIP